MKKITVPCLIIVIIIGCLFTTVTASNPQFVDNPYLFRTNLHANYQLMKSNGNITIPEFSDFNKENRPNALSFDDLLISESVGPANFTQKNAVIEALTDDRMVAIWEDNRSGPVTLYMQMLDNSGSPIGTNRLLLSADGSNLSNPCVSADTMGNFYLVWREEGSGLLQSARFDSLGTPLTGVFFISDTISLSYAGEFDATCLDNGNLVVAWENYAIENDIAFRIYNTNGSPASSILTANSSGSADQLWSPAITTGLVNDFAIVWEDDRGIKPDIYFRRFNLSGSPYAGEIAISDTDARDSTRFLPSLIYSPIDGYIAAWIDLRENQNIFAQIVSSSGAMLGSNVLLSDAYSTSSNWEIDLAVDNSGMPIAAWTIYGQYNVIVLQRYINDLQKEGITIVVSDPVEKLRFMPALAGNSSGNIAIVWSDLISGSTDIYCDILNSIGVSTGSDFIINDDTTGSPSIEPDVTHYGKYEWDIVFTDMRRDAGDIMLQRVYVLGSLIGGNRMINTDPAGGRQFDPAIASNTNKMLICWTDERDGIISGQNIFCRFSSPNYEITDELAVNDDYAGSAVHYNSRCAINPLGMSLVSWTDNRTGNAKIYSQLFNDVNEAIGSNSLIGPDESGQIGEMPNITIDPNGDFVVAYLNRLATGGPAIEVKKVNTSGTISPMFTYQSDKSGFQIDGFELAINSTGTYYIVWHGYSSSGPELFVTLFNADGLVTLATTAITDHTESAPEMPSISIDAEGYLFITWLDNRTGEKTPYKQIFRPDLAPFSGNVPAHAATGPFMRNPVAANHRGRGIVVWSDGRENGLNIYAAQELYSPTSTDDNPILPGAYDLEQNRPNPFNPATCIKFMLPKTGNIKLEIINLLGQRVKLLADGQYPAGSHSVIWDGTSDAGEKAASGIYFYRLSNAEFQKTKKMVLLK